MPSKHLNFPILKFLFIFHYIQLCSSGLITFTYDQKAGQIVFSKKRWFLSGIIAVFITFSLFVNIYVTFGNNEFLTLEKVTEISAISFANAYVSLIIILFSLWIRAEKIAILLNNGILLIRDIDKLVGIQNMFNADSKIVIFYKITFFLTRLIIYLWHVVETNHNKSSFLTLISILLTFEFNAIQVASNWHFFISVIQWRLYTTFSQSFEIFLKNNFQNSNDSNRKDKLANIRIYQCCDISDRIDGYAKILGRMCQISSEINDNFGILITAVIAFNYLNITTDSYYMYFIYVSQQQIHLENLTVLTRKYIMVFAELIATILTIFVSNSTMYHARKLESDIEAYTSLQKLDERLEETVSFSQYFMSISN